MRYYAIALFAIFMDQASKWLVVKNMELYESFPMINNFFYISSHRNRGAAFGILQNKLLFFIITTLVVVAVIVYYIWKLRTVGGWLAVVFSLILGGAIGNLIDRIYYGEVIDFLDLRFGTYNYPIFNLADSFIVIGVAILVFLSVFCPQLVTDKDYDI